MAGVEIQQLDLPDEGVLALGIRRWNGDYVGAPRDETVVQPGDILVLCGEAERLAELSRRPTGEAGDRAHREAVDRHDDAVRDQDDRERRGGYEQKRSGRTESEPRR